MTDKAAEDGGAAEQKDAYGAVQSSATDKTAESGEAVKQKRANGKEAANEKAAGKKGADENTSSSFLQKARKFFTEQVAQKEREDGPLPRSGAGWRGA